MLSLRENERERMSNVSCAAASALCRLTFYGILKKRWGRSIACICRERERERESDFVKSDFHLKQYLRWQYSRKKSENKEKQRQKDAKRCMICMRETKEGRGRACNMWKRQGNDRNRWGRVVEPGNKRERRIRNACKRKRGKRNEEIWVTESTLKWINK